MTVSFGNRDMRGFEGKPRVILGEQIAQHGIEKRIEKMKVYPSGNIKIWVKSSTKTAAIFHRIQLPTFSSEIEFSNYLDNVFWNATQSVGFDEYFIRASVRAYGGGGGLSSMKSKLSPEMRMALEGLQKNNPAATVSDLLLAVIPRERYWPDFRSSEGRLPWNIKWVQELLAAGADPNAKFGIIYVRDDWGKNIESSSLKGAPVLWVVCNEAISKSSRYKDVFGVAKLLLEAGATVDAEFHGIPIIGRPLAFQKNDLVLLLLEHLFKNKEIKEILSTAKNILKLAIKHCNTLSIHELLPLLEKDACDFQKREYYAQQILLNLPKDLYTQLETLKLLGELKQRICRLFVVSAITGTLSEGVQFIFEGGGNYSFEDLLVKQPANILKDFLSTISHFNPTSQPPHIDYNILEKNMLGPILKWESAKIRIENEVKHQQNLKKIQELEAQKETKVIEEPSKYPEAGAAAKEPVVRVPAAASPPTPTLAVIIQPLSNEPKLPVQPSGLVGKVPSSAALPRQNPSSIAQPKSHLSVIPTPKRDPEFSDSSLRYEWGKYRKIYSHTYSLDDFLMKLVSFAILEFSYSDLFILGCQLSWIDDVIKAGANPNAANEESPLEKCCDSNSNQKEGRQEKRAEIARKLLAHGASTYTRPGKEPLIKKSIIYKQEHIFRALLRYINVNEVDRSGETLLDIAIEWRNDEAAKELINAGADIGKGFPLHLSIQYEREDVFELILSKNPDVNKKDSEGMTPLFRAVGLQYIHKLIKAGAQVNLHLAFNTNLSIFERLIKAGIDVDSMNSEHPHTCLQVLCMANKWDDASMNKLHTLLRLKADTRKIEGKIFEALPDQVKKLFPELFDLKNIASPLIQKIMHGINSEIYLKLEQSGKMKEVENILLQELEKLPEIKSLILADSHESVLSTKELANKLISSLNGSLSKSLDNRELASVICDSLKEWQAQIHLKTEAKIQERIRQEIQESQRQELARLAEKQSEMQKTIAGLQEQLAMAEQAASSYRKQAEKQADWDYAYQQQLEKKIDEQKQALRGAYYLSDQTKREMHYYGIRYK